MPTGHLNGVLCQLRRAALLHEGGAPADGQLLEHFLAEHDETAFEALVHRHGPMVMGVCRRVLRNFHDAEDAFQATFLVLVRKAASIVPREMVANWLYGVAYRTALGAKTATARRRAKEREMPIREALEEDIWGKLRPLLDQELSHLPDKYRVPIVLCDLEGKSRKAAALHLGWSEGTLSGRLARARVLLARRLAARGLTLSGGALAAALAHSTALASVPAPLMMSTVKAAALLAAGSAAAAGMVPAKVAVLVQGVLRAMIMTKLKIATAWLLAVGVVGGGVGIMSYPTQVSAQASPKEKTEPISIAPLARAGTTPGPAASDDKLAGDRAKAPRCIEAGNVLIVKLVNPIKHVPEKFLGRHEVGPEGRIVVGENTFLTVRGQTVEQVKGLLAHLLKRRYTPDLSYEEIKRNLQITIASAEDEARQRQFQINLIEVRVGRVPGNTGVREEHKVETSPSAITREGQEVTFSVGYNGQDAVAGRPGFLSNGLQITAKVTDLRDGRLRLESKLECSWIERNDKDSTRLAIQAVCAVDIVEPGDLVTLELKNDKSEVCRYAIVSVHRVEAESAQKPASQGHPLRVGEIKIVGNSKVPSGLILRLLPLGGEFLSDADLRRAEKNLVRLGFFEVNPKKNIRPTVVVLDPDDDSDFRDILITVREK